MSLHDCRVQATLTLKEEVTERQIRDALSHFLEQVCMMFDAEVSEGNIEVKGGTLSLCLEFYGDGSGTDPDIAQLVDDLARVVPGGQWLEFMDFDAGDSEDLRRPYFIGTPEEIRIGKMKYGLAQLQKWVDPERDCGILENVSQALLKHAGASRPSGNVKAWDAYDPTEAHPFTHQLDITDQRITNGQVYADFRSLSGNSDEAMSITMEINHDPLGVAGPVPCAHIHFNDSEMAMALFKIGDKILVRPETNVSVNAVQDTCHGIKETLYWVC